MSLIVKLEDEEQTRCHILLYNNVKNAADVRQLIMKGQVEASLIKPEMLVDPFQVLVAANKAVRSLAAKKMITDSLKNFGLGDSDTEILAVVLDQESGEKLQKLNGQIKGQQTALTEMLNLTNSAKIKQLYKVTDADLDVSNLLDAVISRMACKEFLIM
ncbi:EKC/KEOPS complex subunit Tprkb isoform X2 [Procambarus clarkii]|uniref:EKC/KEOPS complex subunit Tprkb isoform X2 n=1 Tax=Procambarus clarkii TaxID=6728 RepID=UPI001E6764E5|nr:EKC/KEOPS complex subunit Tprkb-like isoform X2 [Procambarus clarkii]